MYQLSLILILVSTCQSLNPPKSKPKPGNKAYGVIRRGAETIGFGLALTALDSGGRKVMDMAGGETHTQVEGRIAQITTDIVESTEALTTATYSSSLNEVMLPFFPVLGRTGRIIILVGVVLLVAGLFIILCKCLRRKNHFYSSASPNDV